MPFLVPVTNIPHPFLVWPSSTWSNFMSASFKVSLTFSWDLHIWRVEMGKSTCNTGTLYTVKLLCEFCRWQLLTRFFWLGYTHLSSWDRTISGITLLRRGNSLRHCQHSLALGWSDKKHMTRGLSLRWIALQGGWEDVPCWLFALSTLFSRLGRQGFRWLLPFFPAAFFCGSARLLLEGLWRQEDFKRKATCWYAGIVTQTYWISVKVRKRPSFETNPKINRPIIPSSSPEQWLHTGSKQTKQPEWVITDLRSQGPFLESPKTFSEPETAIQIACLSLYMQIWNGTWKRAPKIGPKSFESFEKCMQFRTFNRWVFRNIFHSRCMRSSVEVCWFPGNSLVNPVTYVVSRESWQKVEQRKTKLIASISAINWV